MPEYRKKRRNRILDSHSNRGEKRPRKRNKNEDIIMTSDNEKKPKKSSSVSNIKVLKGRKLENKKKFRLFLVFVAVIVAVLVILESILPAGLIKSASNSLALIGSGSYPQELESTNTLDVISMGSHYYLLSDTELIAFSNSGKKLFSYIHGFERPVLKTSRWGALLFDQGKTTALLFDLNGLQKTIETKLSIITGGFSDSGAYALVTDSENYACAVSVYNKNGKRLYEWYSAGDTVNNVTISPNNKKIAVSSYNTENGEINSQVSVLNFKSATPESSKEYKSTMVYGLNNWSSGRFSVATIGGLDFIKWNKYKAEEYKSDYKLSILREAYHGTVAVFNREGNISDNKVVVFSKNGKKKYEFDFKGIISDIRLFGGHIYCMSDTEIYLFDKDGSVLRDAQIGFGGVKMVVTGTNTVLVITDNKIERIRLEKEKTQ